MIRARFRGGIMRTRVELDYASQPLQGEINSGFPVLLQRFCSSLGRGDSRRLRRTAAQPLGADSSGLFAGRTLANRVASGQGPLSRARRRSRHAVFRRFHGVEPGSGFGYGSKNKKGTLSEKDDCGGPSGIATVTQGSGNAWVVTAGPTTGSCTAEFDYLSFKHGKRIGWAQLSITNSL
jgi:hypothetical protein